MRIGLKPMADGAVMDGSSFGDPEGDGLLACHTLHEAVGDALVVGRALVHRSRDEWCADAYGRHRWTMALFAIVATANPGVADGDDRQRTMVIVFVAEDADGLLAG